jgi:hypothetical protein
MRFTLSTRTRQAIDAIVGEWMGETPVEMTARLMALSLEDACEYLAMQAILTDLEAIAARPSIKRRKP